MAKKLTDVFKDLKPRSAGEAVALKAAGKGELTDILKAPQFDNKAKQAPYKRETPVAPINGDVGGTFGKANENVSITEAFREDMSNKYAEKSISHSEEITKHLKKHKRLAEKHGCHDPHGMKDMARCLEDMADRLHAMVSSLEGVGGKSEG